jgi:hypothetical protein
MIHYYIVRDVEPGAICSYKPGRTLLNNGPINRQQESAERVAERYNKFLACSGVRYVVVPHDDKEIFKCDYFENDKTNWRDVITVCD